GSAAMICCAVAMGSAFSSPGRRDRPVGAGKDGPQGGEIEAVAGSEDVDRGVGNRHELSAAQPRAEYGAERGPGEDIAVGPARLGAADQEEPAGRAAGL